MPIAPCRSPLLLRVPALVAGWVEEGPKQVVLEPLGLTFGSDDRHVRA